MTYTEDAAQTAAWVTWLGAEADRLQAGLEASHADNLILGQVITDLEEVNGELQSTVLTQQTTIARLEARVAVLREQLDACQNNTTTPMLVGTSLHREAGESYADAFARRTRNWGAEPEVVRYFDSDWKLDSWPIFGNARCYVSFKGEPATILSGAYDAHYRDLFAKAPKDRDVYWTYWHEPEDDTEDGRYTADMYRRAFDHIAAIEDQASNSTRIFRGPILMGWTVNPTSGRAYRNWIPSVMLDFIGWDIYPGLDVADVRTKYGYAAQATKDVGVDQWVICETAPRLGWSQAQLAAWIPQATQAARELGFAAWCYFDSTVGGDFRIKDPVAFAAMGAEIGK